MDKKEFRKYLVISVLAIIVCYAVQNLSLFTKGMSVLLTAMFPLVLGCVLAYLFNIILNSLERHYFPKSHGKAASLTRRPVCVGLSFLIVILIITLVLNIVIPELIRAVKLVTAGIPPLAVRCRDFLVTKFKEYPEIQVQITEALDQFDPKEIDWASLTTKITGILQSGVVGIISSAVGIVGAITGTVTNIVLALIFAVYLLIRKDTLIRDAKRAQKVYFSEKTNQRLNHFLETANQTFRSFIIGQFVEALILGSLCFIGMKILQLPYAAMSGTLVGVTALIPIVGAFIGAGVSAFIIFTENPMQALIFLIFLVILQQIEGNVIYPKVVGNSIGLPGIWVLAAVTLGGGLFGILGMILGVPLAATAYKLFFQHLESKEAPEGAPVPAAAEAPPSPPEPQAEPKKETPQKQQRTKKRSRKKK
ncbi:MAG TPA: AI-2E family transporter [Ruminococcus sp.]|nr:AI-2E family transporter [Ruminococcus sp.]